MITLYRGDDTGGQLGKNVKIAFHCDDAVDMDGVIVHFSLLDVITKEWTNVHDGDILELSITHEQSGRLPLGSLFGKIWGEDPSGRVRTFANRLPIIVTNDLRKVYGSDGLDSQDIHVYSPVGWDAIANKPTLFPSKIELVEGLPEALDGVVKSVNGKTADAAGAVTLTLDSFANKDGEIQVKQTLMVSRDGGQTFNAVATLVDVWNEIDNHNSSATAHANLMAAIANTYARKSTTYTKTEVDDKINQFAAHYLTADVNGSAFATVAALTGATAYYYAGVVVSPTKNDYAIVLDDDGKTARWAFFGEGETGVWQRQYYISSVSFTDEQWAAINSGIKDYLVPKVLTIDESTATKKIVLGDKTFTSFAELTALVQNGVTRLKYYVTDAEGRPVLYTAHLCDASTIRFDATGTLGETVYTRSIAITKDGDDGIAVSVGALTQVAKASELAWKLNTNWDPEISFGWGESRAAIGYRAEHYDNAILMTDASWGPYFIVRINGTDYTLTFPNQGGRVVLSDEGTNELPEPIKAALFAGEAFREAAFGKAATSAANLESGNVAVVDGSAGGTVTVSFKANATGDNSLRYCELLVTGVTADDAVTISLPAGTYQFADGADKTSKGNNHFVFAEYGGGWMVNKTVRTEATITEG